MQRITRSKIKSLCALALCLMISACQQSTSENTIKIGTIAGPESDLVKAAQDKTESLCHVKLKVIEFSDYNLPNAALHDGSLDANIYQHEPYLKAAVAAHGYKFEVIGETFLFPTGVYAAKIKTIDELPAHAKIAIPNDPSNEARALKLLAYAKLISLDPKAGDTPTLKDIQSNPMKLQFKLLDAAQLPRVLPDVDAAVINTTFAIPAGLSPSKDAILRENTDSPYVNLIVMNSNSLKREALLCFVKAMHSSDDVLKAAQKAFGNDAVPAWKNVL